MISFMYLFLCVSLFDPFNDSKIQPAELRIKEENKNGKSENAGLTMGFKM